MARRARLALLQATARPALTSGQFRHGPIYVREGAWTELDADDPAVREVLLEYVPSHIRLAQRQEHELDDANLALLDDALRAKLELVFAADADALLDLRAISNGRLLDLLAWGPRVAAARRLAENAQRTRLEAEAAERDRLAEEVAAAERAKAEAEKAKAEAEAAIAKAEAATATAAKSVLEASAVSAELDEKRAEAEAAIAAAAAATESKGRASKR